MPLFPTKSHDDFHHRGFVIDYYDFSHGKSQRGEYFSFEKKKAVLRNLLVRPNSGPDRQSSTNSPLDRKQRSPRTAMWILRTASRSNRQRNRIEFGQGNSPAAVPARR